MKYEKHIFICCNQRPAGARKSCGEAHGLELVTEFKKVIKERGIEYPIRAQKSGCLEVCDLGPTIVIYPEGVFYGNVQISDVTEIVESHLINNKIVERLRLSFGTK